MKLNDFKDELRSSLERICNRKSWTVDNNKQRGMALSLHANSNAITFAQYWAGKASKRDDCHGEPFAGSGKST